MLSPEKPMADLNAALIEAPGINGQLGILPGHATFVSELKSGVLKIKMFDSGLDEAHYFVAGGFLQVSDNHVKVMAEVIETSDQVDRKRAEESEKRALERLADTSNSDININRALLSLERAKARKALLVLTTKRQ